MYLRKYRLRKTWLDQCLKSRVSEDPSTDNMANGSKHCCNLKEAPLAYLLITVNVIALEKVSFSDTKDRKSFCEHSDCRWQALSASWRPFNATNWDEIISKRKTPSEFVCAFLNSTLKFKHFAKTGDTHSTCISAITGSEKHG